MKPIGFFLSFVIILIPTTLFGWLLWQELVPTGVFEVEKQIGEASPFVDDLQPASRVHEAEEDAAGDLVQMVYGDPVFFFSHPHRSFETIEAEVWFKNDEVSILEFGGLADSQTSAYDLHPLQNTLIDALGWSWVSDGERVLLQREDVYESLEAFLVDPPEREVIATYHDSLDVPYRIEGYVPLGVLQTMNVSLRGFHAMKTYVKDETLRFTFSYMDMNRSEGDDPVRVLVYNEDGQVVSEGRAEDDGNISRDAIPSTLQTITVEAHGLPEGVYKIDVNVGTDIFVRSLTTLQQKMVFLNNVYFGDEVAYREPPDPVSFVTNARNLAFQTRHAEGVQEIVVGEEVVSVAEPFARYTMTRSENALVSASLPLGDMEIQTDGYLALSAEQFFHPDAVRMGALTDVDSQGIDYVLTTYQAPRVIDDWYVKTIVFDASLLELNEENAWKFVFSAPDIDRQEAAFSVGKLHMTWKRASLTLSELLEEVRYVFTK